MQIKDIMSNDLEVLPPDLSLRQASAVLVEKGLEGAPVIEGGRLLGVFNRTHVVQAVAQGADLSQPIRGLMTPDYESLSPYTDIMNLDLSYTGNHPVLDEGRLVGFVTRSDLMLGLNAMIIDISSQMETVINSTYNPIIAIDRDGMISTWNQAAETLLGVTREEALGCHINEVIPESKILNVADTGQSEFGIKVNMGEKSVITNRAPIIKNGEIIGVVAVLYDVSDVEAISRELASVKALNREMDAIIDSSFDGLYITDNRGLTLRINKAVTRMTGLGEEQFLNRTMYELVEDGILSRSASVIVIEQKKPVTTTLTTITGTTLLVSATPVFDEKGEIFRIVTSVRDISELNMLKQKVEQLQGLRSHFEFQMNELRMRWSGELVFKNKEMEKIIHQAMKVAEVDSTVLISGESGVGKEVMGEIIQRNSNRHLGPFIKLNCGAIPENLLESELFGYEAGAFTGALKQGKPGLFEVANGGTLLLDEVGDIPLHLQVKLLRALQQREIMRVGGTQPIKIDVRIIAITNKDLASMVRKGAFREDLYYRLNVVPIHVPPLRERREEIPLLIKHFLNGFNERYNLKKTIDPEAIDVMLMYDWPGNIRELENLVERLVVTSTAESISRLQLPGFFFRLEDSLDYDPGQPISVNRIVPLKIAVESVERMLLEKTFSIAASCHKAASILEVDASTISRKAHKYGIRIQ
ncbi:MAG TPA: sigma 54-interacting transcriptional regulator [Syntrophomonadaceae bacterium]|nr:sigma 54-interacting transcriptional regulator [Syntrophomonadaceae bacterium]